MSAFREVDKYRVLALCILFMAVAEFLIRGPVRGFDPGLEWNDFASPYLAARAWVQGSPPYQAANLVRIWTSLGGEPFDISDSFNRVMRARPRLSADHLAANRTLCDATVASSDDSMDTSRSRLGRVTRPHAGFCVSPPEPLEVAFRGCGSRSRTLSYGNISGESGGFLSRARGPGGVGVAAPAPTAGGFAPGDKPLPETALGMCLAAVLSAHPAR